MKIWIFLCIHTVSVWDTQHVAQSLSVHASGLLRLTKEKHEGVLENDSVLRRTEDDKFLLKKIKRQDTKGDKKSEIWECLLVCICNMQSFSLQCYQDIFCFYTPV